MRITVRNSLTGKTMTGEFDSFPVSSSTVVVHFGNLIGAREFNFNHGYGTPRPDGGVKEKAIRDWMLTPSSLEAVRALAKEKGKEVKPCGKSPGRKRQPKRGPNPHPKQMHFGSMK
jgi:hypothetical protein